MTYQNRNMSSGEWCHLLFAIAIPQFIEVIDTSIQIKVVLILEILTADVTAWNLFEERFAIVEMWVIGKTYLFTGSVSSVVFSLLFWILKVLLITKECISSWLNFVIKKSLLFIESQVLKIADLVEASVSWDFSIFFALRFALILLRRLERLEPYLSR